MKKLLDFLKGKKTVIFNTVAGVAAVIWGPEAAKAISDLGLTVDQAWAALAAAYAAANVALRAVTSTPIFKKSK